MSNETGNRNLKDYVETKIYPPYLTLRLVRNRGSTLKTHHMKMCPYKELIIASLFILNYLVFRKVCFMYVHIHVVFTV